MKIVLRGSIGLHGSIGLRGSIALRATGTGSAGSRPGSAGVRAAAPASESSTGLCTGTRRAVPVGASLDGARHARPVPRLPRQAAEACASGASSTAFRQASTAPRSEDT